MKKVHFIADQFVATKFKTANDKAMFGNRLIDFLLGGCQESMFTEKLYGQLMHCFGHIAHYNRRGFYDEWFSSDRRKWNFVEVLTEHCPCGDPRFTFSDVEEAIQKKVRELRLDEQYWNRAVGLPAMPASAPISGESRSDSKHSNNDRQMSLLL